MPDTRTITLPDADAWEHLAEMVQEYIDISERDAALNRRDGGEEAAKGFDKDVADARAILAALQGTGS